MLEIFIEIRTIFGCGNLRLKLYVEVQLVLIIQGNLEEAIIYISHLGDNVTAMRSKVVVNCDNRVVYH